MAFSGELRRPVVAGAFYPGSPDALRAMVDDLLAQAAKSGPEPVALISPHAGYVYSGHVAAAALKQAEGVDYDALIVLGTNHTDPLGQGLAVWPSGAFRTPLGDVAVDADLAHALIDADRRITAQRSPHLREHSIEVQLPFLQRVQPGKSFVPIVVCDSSLESCQALAEAFVKVLKERKPLIVASSDLAHYPSYEDAVRVDRACLNAVLSLDPLALEAAIEEALEQRVPNLHTCMCGEAPIKVVMLYAQAIGAKADLIKYANSGDVPVGDKGQVVGYGAVRFARGAANSSDELTDEDKATLLRVARQTLTEYLQTGKRPAVSTQSPALRVPCATFVTLRVRRTGELRGCRGEIAARFPLVESVQNNAIASAVDDPRFAPVTADEVPGLHIEISILTPMRPIHPDKVEVGRHGLMIFKGRQSGLLLPQVPVEQGWTREEFLRGLCHKAWLPENAWQDRDAQLYAFEAIVFGEEE